MNTALLIDIKQKQKSKSDFWELPFISYMEVREMERVCSEVKSKKTRDFLYTACNEMKLVYFIQNSDSPEAEALADYYSSLSTQQRQTIARDIEKRGELRNI